MSKSLQMVTCEVLLPNSQSEFIISFVYATNEEHSRIGLWEEIVCLASNQRIMGKGWSVLGDFNQTLNHSDHSDPQTQNVDLPTRLFRDSLVNANLADLTYRGCSFTWWNKRTISPIAKKIDKFWLMKTGTINSRDPLDFLALRTSRTIVLAALCFSLQP